MLSRYWQTPLTALLAVPVVLGQTWTVCNPLNATCPSDMALGTTGTWNFTGGNSADQDIWNQTATQVTYADDGAEFTINQKGDSPTIQSTFYFFFGRVSCVMKAAPGTGIVSSIVLQSDDLDEVDWEMIGGNKTSVQTNFFGKGNTTSYDRAIWYDVDDNQNYHNYTTVWTNETLQWMIDGQTVRTLSYNDTLALSGKNYPQTPMNVKIGNWAGGDPSENSNDTVNWAGGVTAYKNAPYTMVVQYVEVEDFSAGKTYTYGDRTGDWTSIQIAAGNSTVAKSLNDPKGVTGHYKALSKTAKIGIAAGSIGAFAILAALMTFCCIKQRRAGRRERTAADQEWSRSQNELGSYKRMMISEEEIHPRTGPTSRFG